VAKVFREIVHMMPPPVSSLLPSARPEVDQLFDSALAKIRDERPVSLEQWSIEVAEKLESMDGNDLWPPTFAPSLGFTTPVPTVRHL
jgi:hypothetical protein